jgi:hypothetical protein
MQGRSLFCTILQKIIDLSIFVDQFMRLDTKIT